MQHGFGARGFGRGRKVPVWMALVIILGLMTNTAAWSIRKESIKKSEKEVAGQSSWGMRSAWDAAAAFMWERLLGVDVKEDPNSLMPKIDYYRQCHSFRCRFHAVQDGASDLLIGAVTDPIGMWKRWWKAFNNMADEGFPFINEALGFFILYVILNMLAITCLRFEKMVTLLLEIVYLFFTMPFFLLIWRAFSICWKFVTFKTKDLQKAAKIQRRTDVKKRKEEAAAETNRNQQRQ